MGPVKQIIVGMGPAPADVTLDLGTEHPTSHGALRLNVDVDDDGVIRGAQGMPGLLHRGAEKLFEARDYRQALMLADRHDWHGAFSSEVGAALAIERLVGLTPPDRATWLRTLLSEVTRVQAALVFAGSALSHSDALLTREWLLDHMESYTGNRIHPMINRIGGLAADVSPQWLDALVVHTPRIRSVADDLRACLAVQSARFAGIAVLTRGDALTLGASGPVARASGVDVDLRRDDPYLAYGDLDVRVITRTSGDSLARLEVICTQIEASLDLIDACAMRLRDLDGPVNVRLPKVLRAPEESTYVWTENPAGINGFHVVSTGEPTPWRMKIRSGGFANLQALARALPGTRMEDLAQAVMSFALTAGDIDR